MLEGDFSPHQLKQYAQTTGPKTIDARILMGEMTAEDLSLLGLAPRKEYAYSKVFHVQEEWVRLRTMMMSMRPIDRVGLQHDDDRAEVAEAFAAMLARVDDDCKVS